MTLDPFGRRGGDRRKQLRAVVAAEQFIAGIFRMGHQAEDVAPLVAHPGDVFQGAVGIGRRRRFAFGIDIVQEDLAILVQAFEGRGIGEVTTLAMLDGDFQKLAFF
jgi:hypothetical protein